MAEKQDGYTVLPFSRFRRMTAEGMQLGARKGTIHGLIEVDVTQARQILREYKARTGETLSFTAFIVACLGKAVDADKRVHAYRDWRNRLIVFDEVDVNTLVETEVEGEKVVVPRFIRAANRRTFREIHDEIRSFQGRAQSSRELQVMKLFGALPAVLRKVFYAFVFRQPHLLKKTFCTVSVTAVGMFGEGGGWGIPVLNHSLSVTVGGIVERPAFVGERVERREFLCLTLSFDHTIIDGAPAARFASHFKALIESAYGLCV